MNQIIKSKIKGALLIGVLGDALGVPTEMRIQKFLKEKYGTVNDFLPAKENLFFDKGGFTGDEIGYYSDDTVLTFAIAKSIAEIGGIDIGNIFQKQIEGYYSYPYGFGSNTRMAFEKIEQGIPIEEIENINGGGNGIMMKQFPLAAYFALHESEKESENQVIINISKVSHAHPAALVAAIVHHNFLKILLKSDPETLDKKKSLEEIRLIAQEQESKFTNREGRKFSELIGDIAGYIDAEGKLNIDNDQIMKNFGWEGEVKRSGFITVTFGIVYCLFFRDMGIQSMRDAVNFGGDTDTYASILGNMLGALNGEIYDEKLLNKIKDIDELKKQADDFISKIT